MPVAANDTQPSVSARYGQTRFPNANVTAGPEGVICTEAGWIRRVLIYCDAATTGTTTITVDTDAGTVGTLTLPAAAGTVTLDLDKDEANNHFVAGEHIELTSDVVGSGTVDAEVIVIMEPY